jgi:hypothetical protein
MVTPAFLVGEILQTFASHTCTDSRRRVGLCAAIKGMKGDAVYITILTFEMHELINDTFFIQR